LQQLTKRVAEAALDGEITDHLGYDKGDLGGKNGGNSRNGNRGKTVLTEAHLAEVYGADVSRQTISTITDRVLASMAEWQNRPLDRVYPVIFPDVIHVKIRDGKVANRPIYVALAVTVEGTRDILGLWAGAGGEGAQFWLQVLSELKNRGVADALMVVCDGLKGLPDAIGQTWPLAVVQTCVIHLLRNSFRYAGRQHYAAIAEALRPVYTAPTEASAKARFGEFAEARGRALPGDRPTLGQRV
jgi:putative transposase